MNFELLPNETILDLFEYISIFDLFHGFFDINSRFNQLLCVKFDKIHLDLRLLSKTKCNHICQNIIPLIIDRIISLHLSNDHDTPQQMKFFLSHQYQIRQFTRLQSISLSYIRSQQILEQILIECSHLPYLTHLSLHDDDNVFVSEIDASRYYNYIWRLKQLIYCDFSICSRDDNSFPDLTVISTSLKRLIIRHNIYSISTLTHLYHQTPNLEYLSITFHDESDPLESEFPILSLTRLQMSFSGSIQILEYLLQHMPNLCHLKLETNDIYINGYQWETIIRKYLPNLKIFRFKIQCRLSRNKDEEVQLNEIVDTYRTKFWIDEHQWFIRCNWFPPDEDEYNYIEIFTVPYTFHNYSITTNNILSKSTCPSDAKYFICNRVTDLYCIYLNSTFSIVSNFYFTNIQRLSLSLPFNDQFLILVPKFDRLISLCFFVKNNESRDKVYSQMQYLLDRMPYLRSFRLNSWSLPDFQLLIPETKNTSIRRLDLQGFALYNNSRCCDNEECVKLCRSSLGKQCETLLIRVKNRTNVLYLINNMPKLQALNIQFDDNSTSSVDEDELIKWLHQQLSSTCTITNDSYHGHNIRLWIR